MVYNYRVIIIIIIINVYYYAINIAAGAAWKLQELWEKIKLTSRVSCDLEMSSVKRLLNSPRPQSAIYNEPSPVFLDSHPSSSTPKSPDLAKILSSTGSSSDSPNQDHGLDHQFTM